MARLTFPSDRDVRLSSPYRGAAFVSAAGLTVTVYSDSAGTVLADVQNFDGSANAAATFTVDTNSELPLFLGPAAGSDTLYVKVNNSGAPVVPVYAIAPSDVSAAVATEVTNRSAADAAHVAASDPHGDRIVASAALTAHASNTSNPHGVTKAQVGLGNADNTTDAGKPVSTAQQAALDAKAPLASPALTGTPTINGATLPATYAALLDVRDTEQVKARAMTAWHSALALRDTTPAKMVILGDSVTEGRGASANPPASDPRYVGKLLARMRNRFPPATPVVGGLGYIPTMYAGSGMTSPWVVANGPSQSLNQGLGLRSYALANASHSLTITVVGTSCDLHYLKGATSRIMGYQVDGGTVNTVETNGGTVTDNGILRITLGSAGSHTLKLTWSSGGSVFPEGIYVYNGDENTGVQLYEAGHSSYRVSDLIAQQTNVVTRLNAIGPALVVIEFGINEYNTSVPSATFRTNLQTLIAGIRSTVTSAPSIVLVGYPDNSSPPYAEPWANYVQALYDVAAADTGGLGGASGVTVCDLSKRLPATSVSTYSLWADTFHPNDKGHATIADALLAFISPR